MTKQEIELFYQQLQKLHNEYVSSTPESRPKNFTITSTGNTVVSPSEIAVSFNVKFVLQYDLQQLKLSS